MPDEPGAVSIRIDDAEDPPYAVKHVGQIIDGANQVAGRAFHAVAGATYWPQTGETL